MHDINGKALHIGDEIHTYAHGLMTIKEILEEHDPHKGGSLLEVSNGKFLGTFTVRTHENKVTKVRTWKELAQQCLDVQDASNLSGVVKSFADIITEVRVRLDAEGKGGTDNINRHPVCVLFADKISSLAGESGSDTFRRAYEWACKETGK